MSRVGIYTVYSYIERFVKACCMRDLIFAIAYAKVLATLASCTEDHEHLDRIYKEIVEEVNKVFQKPINRSSILTIDNHFHNLIDFVLLKSCTAEFIRKLATYAGTVRYYKIEGFYSDQ